MSSTPSQNFQPQPNYEFHLPRAFSYPLPGFLLGLSLASLSYFLLRQNVPTLAIILGAVFLLGGGIYLGICLILRRITNLERRLKGRDKFLEQIPWQGTEHILDVGCGNGILLLGAAKRLTSGTGIGIDIWTEGSGDNFPEAFRQNAMIEGVAERVSLENEDVRNLPYEDQRFDVIISGLTMHHLGFDTPPAIAEMVRVLKPGGWLGIYDEPSTIFYCTKLMRQNQLKIQYKTADMVFATKSN